MFAAKYVDCVVKKTVHTNYFMQNKVAITASICNTMKGRDVGLFSILN